LTSFRLSLQDYHHYHSLVSGSVEYPNAVLSDYYGFDPPCLRSRIGAIAQNARCALVIDSPGFGQVIFVAIGAVEVETQTVTRNTCTKAGGKQFQRRSTNSGAKIEKGKELGMPESGGLNVAVIFEQGQIELDDEDLLSVSKRGARVDVGVGQRLRRA
ncbi:unnamed protein product, partial [Tuber aestivum]